MQVVTVNEYSQLISISITDPMDPAKMHICGFITLSAGKRAIKHGCMDRPPTHCVLVCQYHSTPRLV